MAKSIPIKMETIRKTGLLQSAGIPINIYEEDYHAELRQYGKETMVRVLHDMLVIREFETMLDNIKKLGEYQGIAYNHLGPAHLSIGQESAAVGQSLVLSREDCIFGSHRSHGEIIAKSLSCIAQMNEGELQTVMEEYFGGAIYRVIETHHPASSIYELAEHFILYGLLAEIFARHNGINKGLGGSMHAFFVPFGSMPNNAIVGGSADIALGAALYKKIHNKNGIVIANIGDAAMACGPVWEAIIFSAMDQYHSLWKDAPGAPPYMLNVFNNFYGMGGQPMGETMGVEYIGRIASGVNAESMHAERVDGFNPLAVADAVRRKKTILQEGRGPVMLDTITYRISGHSPSDASSYRTKEEIDEFIRHDAISSYRDRLVAHELITEAEVEQMAELVKQTTKRTLEIVVNTDISPYVQADVIAPLMFSRRRKAIDISLQPSVEQQEKIQVRMPKADNPRLKQLEGKYRYAYDESGKLYPTIKLYTLRDAIFEAVLDNVYAQPDLIIYGEENRDWGGAFACYRGLTEALPNHRLFNSPISEGAIVGTGVGYALSGGTALVELMYCDFLGRAGDEVFNQMPKWQAMSGGTLTMPLVLRISVGDKYGAQHSQDWTALLAHIPGLMIMYPSTPYDAKGMLHYALSHSDPVVFVESQRLYGTGEQFYREGVPKHSYEVPLGEPIARTKGTDLTIISIGAALYPVLETDKILREQHSIVSEVIDLRFINPLQYDLLLESVKKTGKVMLVGASTERASFLHTVASHISANVFQYLDTPPIVMGSQNWITPPAELEDAFFPNITTILDTIDQNLIPLNDYASSSVQSANEKIRRNGLGV